MPKYDFRCGGCGAVSEFEQREGDLRCPACGSVALSRVFSAPNVVAGKGEPQGGLCCGRSSRPDGCAPGGCCGH